MRDDCLPRGSYVAIIAEKPRAAEKIALALSQRARKCTDGKIPYWVATYNGKELVIVPSAGHLFKIDTKLRGFPAFSYYWRPMDDNSFQRAFHAALRKLLRGASEYVSACDYDVEGSVICFKIIEAYGDPKRAKRMKFSALTKQEILSAFSRLGPLDVEMIEAGLARHEVDWIWGINVSRALMHAARLAGKRTTLSAGRVQSPTLMEAKRRWEELNLHVPMPSIAVYALLSKDGRSFEARLAEEVKNMREARAIEASLMGGELTVEEYAESTSAISPPPAFNLGDLQKEASRIYGMSPARTEKIAQDLYEEALISYPRTNSQKLPPSIDFRGILAALRNIREYTHLADALLGSKRLEPVQGKMDDPAHPAIHPTGELPGRLDEDHKKIYDLIARRFMATFAPATHVMRARAVLRDGRGLPYEASGAAVVSEGWLAYYPFSRPDERALPRLLRGERLRVSDARTAVHWSKVSQTISRIGLLRWMESVGIGTEATRARIIETLYDRGYLHSERGTSSVTELGEAVATLISELFPSLSSPDLTRELEEALEEVRAGKRRRAEVVKQTVEAVEKALQEYMSAENSGKAKLLIGRALGVKRYSGRCAVCGRDAAEELCERHSKAMEALKKSLPRIAEILDVNEERALEELSRRAGKWVAEAARYLLKR